MKNTFGSDLSLTIFGESHGRAVGAAVHGLGAMQEIGGRARGGSLSCGLHG